jgi:hypothetical protein
MDDLLLVSYMSEQRTCKLITLLRLLFDIFGIEINGSKSILWPSSQVEFLGFDISATGTISLTDSRLRKVKRLSKSLIYSACANRRFVSFAKLRSFLGVAVSCYDACQ